MPRYGLSGREYDQESGLYHFRARAYDPNTGQFMQSDPIGFSGGRLGLYSYVSQNPLRYTDPSGLTETAGVLQTSALGAVFGGIAKKVGGIAGVFVANRTLTQVSRAGFKVYSVWDDLNGDRAKELQEEIKGLAEEIDSLHDELETEQEKCYRELGPRLKSLDAQTWHVQEAMRRCLENARNNHESQQRPLWLRLKAAQAELNNLFL